MSDEEVTKISPVAVWGSILLWAAVVIWAGVIAVDLYSSEHAARQLVKAHTSEELDAVTLRLDAVIGEVEEAARQLADLLASESADEQALFGHLEAVVSRHPSLAGLGIAYAPFAFDGRHRLYAPMAERRDGHIGLVHVEDAYDYTELYPWYGNALRDGAAWSPPAADERSGRRLVTYSLRVRFGVGREAVIFAMLPMEPLAETVATIDLGEHGYGLLASAGGRIMVHPDESLVRDLASLAEAATTRDGYFPRLDKALASGDPGRFSAISSVTGQRSNIDYRRIRKTGWMVAAVRDRNDLPLDHDLRHSNFLLLTALVVIALLMLPLLDRLVRGPLLGNWTWSVLSSGVLLVGIGFIWYFNLAYPLWRVAGSEVIANAVDLKDSRKHRLEHAVLANQDIPRFVPTGVFVQSMEFITSNNVVITGYIWQRIEDASGTGDPVGFIMPEADTLDVEEAYRQSQDGETVVGWYFRVTLRQAFSYSRFPFDWEAVWVRLWPGTFDENVILVPDLEAYKIMNPSTLPGVDRDLFIGGWTPISSYFEYRINSYRANFGVDEAGVMQDRPELYFNVVIRRNFLDPFISNLTPIILVLLLIFAMLMTIRREAKNRDLLGFNASTIITTCAALFFAVLISHIDLRSSLAAKQIFYLEYFYFITYGAILLICVNSILFTSDSHVAGIHYRDNLLPKLFFWPIVLSAMFLVTLFVFL